MRLFELGIGIRGKHDGRRSLHREFARPGT
jgi:hypothetical protein